MEACPILPAGSAERTYKGSQKKYIDVDKKKRQRISRPENIKTEIRPKAERTEPDQQTRFDRIWDKIKQEHKEKYQ